MSAPVGMLLVTIIMVMDDVKHVTMIAPGAIAVTVLRYIVSGFNGMKNHEREFGE